MALGAYGAALVAAVTWPFLLPGHAFALRDMMVFDSMALTRASLGYGDLAARNVPQDALLGIVPHPVLALRVVMLASAAAGAYYAARLGRSPWGKAAAMTVVLWNPFVVERCLQGQWSLVAAAWLLPAVALACPPAATLAHWLASLTPTGALAAAAIARGRRGLAVSAVTCAPWVVAGLLHASASTASAASSRLFAPRAEELVGTLGAIAGLGGIWNGQAVPASRGAGFAVFGAALFVLLCLGWRAVPRRWLALAGLGFAVALASWSGVGDGLIGHVPGAGIFRDGQKFLLLCVPAFAAAAGALTPRLAAAALGLAVLQVPDAPAALAPLAPTTVAVPDVDDRGRDVFFVDRPALLTRGDGLTVIDPAPKAMNVVESGLLLVDATVADAPSPRWSAARDAVGAGLDPVAPDAGALDLGALDRLAALGIGVVVTPDGRVAETSARARGLPPAGLALFALWCAAPLAGVCRRSRTRR